MVQRELGTVGCAGAMPAPRIIEPRFLNEPFATSEFIESGYSEKVLRGSRFRRVFPRVWVAVEHVMSADDMRRAGRLCMPSQAQMTDLTRIQDLGLDFGPLLPLHFVVESDLHIDVAGIMLHRTVAMPPTDAVGVTPAAAFVAYCTRAHLIDAVAVGEWLLQRKHMSLPELEALVAAEPWRDGAQEVQYLKGMLVDRSRSLPESKLRLQLQAAGIEGLEVNARLRPESGRWLEIDLLLPRIRAAVEYEGSHHQEDRGQYLTDIDRHAELRAMKLHYVLVTKERMRNPRGMVLHTYGRLLSFGYDGPAPEFGAQWDSLFRPVRECVRRQRPGRRYLPAGSRTRLLAS